jgi:hypothetical protein
MGYPSGSYHLLLPTQVTPRHLNSILDWAFAPTFLVAAFTSLMLIDSLVSGGPATNITLGPYSFSGPLFLCPPVLGLAAFSIAACCYHIFIAYSQGRIFSGNTERRLHARQDSMQSPGSASAGRSETQSDLNKP